jgi:hypothetical protein
MDFFEFVFLISLTVLLPYAIVKNIVDYKRSRVQAERGLGEGAGVTVGELKKMLADAVREANAPLVDRIEELEREREGLPSAPPDLLVGAEAGAEDEGNEFEREEHEQGVEKSMGRRVRG